jgi:hypothetical protein
MGLLGPRRLPASGQAPVVSGTAAAAWTTYLATDDAAKSCDLIDSLRRHRADGAPRHLGTEGRARAGRPTRARAVFGPLAGAQPHRARRR